MEEIIAGVIEKSLIGGAFIYMLHYFFNKFATTLETISSTLFSVSDIMRKIDLRMEQVEKRVERLENRGYHNGQG